MFPIILSINLVNLINLTAVGGFIYYFYSKNILLMDSHSNPTFLKPKNHLLPVNINVYREQRLDHIISTIDEYNALFDTSLMLVEEDDSSDSSSDSDSSGNVSEKEEDFIKDEEIKKSEDKEMFEDGDEKDIEKVNVIVENDVDFIEG